MASAEAHENILVVSSEVEWNQMFLNHMKMKINGFSDGETVQPGSGIYANVTWKCRDRGSKMILLLSDSLSRSAKGFHMKVLRKRAKGCTEERFQK